MTKSATVTLDTIIILARASTDIDDSRHINRNSRQIVKTTKTCNGKKVLKCREGRQMFKARYHLSF